MALPLAVSSWLTFAISLSIYWITADPGVSFWDCPEYVTVASRMEVGHPPGNPMWMLAMRVATIPFDPEHHAYVINLCSGLLMAFAAFFLNRVIFVATNLYFRSLYLKFKFSGLYRDILSGIVATGGSLCFAFCDSAWFSAVEAEVYAMSTFLMALSLWIMTLWWKEESASRRSRLLILLAYITGLSLGVHQLNLLLIPVFSLIVLYKSYPKFISPVYVCATVVLGGFLIVLILKALIPGVLFGAQSFELLSVNRLGLSYFSGVGIFIILISILILIALVFTNHSRSPLKNKIPHISTAVWMLLFLLIGFSSFGVIMIRAIAAPPMNEGNPDNIFSLAAYISRDQYPSAPLIYGETPYSRPMLEESFIDGQPVYSKYVLQKEKPLYQPVLAGAKLNHRSGLLSHEDSLNNNHVLENLSGYVLADYKFSQMLTPELNMWFPRMTSRNLGDRTAYEAWGGMSQEEMNKVPISETLDSNGIFLPRIDSEGNRSQVFSYRPTYGQNLQYFVSYQAYYMYFRYLFWNFIGRQNDLPSNGEIDRGNFITGIPLIDKSMLGDSRYFPPEIWKQNKGHNRYFGIPFLLGILGIIMLMAGNRKSRRYLTLVSLLFLMTGLAIVMYLNQGPGEPRERDYTFLGSYMAFAMWIAAGLAWICITISRIKFKKLALVFSFLIVMAPCTLMALENFDDHDRRGRFEPTFYVSSLLDFELPAVIFSHGDNSTFPLWYASEVLKMGEEHIPVDITYLSLPSYVANLKKQGPRSLKTFGAVPEIAYGNFLLTKIPPDSLSKPMSLDYSLHHLYNSPASPPQWPSSLITLKGHDENVVINLHDFSKGSSYLSFKSLMLLEILNEAFNDSLNNDGKVLFFSSLIDHGFYKPLDNWLKPALFGKIYSPRLSDAEATELLKRSVIRELEKLEKINIRPHYIEPVIADRSVRYRGELIMAAQELLNRGDSVLPVIIVEAIENYYPYTELLPGSMTISDTTFYEGKEYFSLLSRLNDIQGDSRLMKNYLTVDSILSVTRRNWLRYYNSLTPDQRRTLSNSGKRKLIK